MSCERGHHNGDKPQIVPLAGNNKRQGAPLYVVYHGAWYLDRHGRVTPHGEPLTLRECERAEALHEAELV